jgi:hypothetical protein
MEDPQVPMLYVDGRCTGLPVRRARRFWARAAGLWAIPPGGSRGGASTIALELRPCAAVHTLGMRRSIDVAFVTADGIVLRAVAGLAPWRLAMRRGAAATWELPDGASVALGVRVGARLQGAVPTAPLAPAASTAPPVHDAQVAGDRHASRAPVATGVHTPGVLTSGVRK